MALTNKSNFQKFVPVNSSFVEGESIDNFINLAEEKYLIPLLGQDFYDELCAIDSPSEEELKLLNPIYRAVSFIAAWLYMPFGNVQISESGMQIVSTNDRKPAFQWQIDKIEQASANMGMDALEKVLSYLETNLGEWATYADGDARKANNSLFINTAEQFDDAYGISRSRLTYICLRSLVVQAEEEMIIPLIGKATANTYKQKIADKTLTEDDETAIRCIRKAIAHLAIKDALATLAVDLSPDGLSVRFLSQSLTTKASVPAPDLRITSTLSHVKEKIVQYLAEIPTLLPGYVAPVTGEVYNVDNKLLKTIFATF